MGSLTGELIINYMMAKIAEVAQNASSVPENQERANYAIDQLQAVLDVMLAACT